LKSPHNTLLSSWTVGIGTGNHKRSWVSHHRDQTYCTWKTLDRVVGSDLVPELVVLQLQGLGVLPLPLEAVLHLLQGPPPLPNLLQQG